jgi:murein DD-endopeptidase MepM/ murein hydrolase activator NlpD
MIRGTQKSNHGLHYGILGKVVSTFFPSAPASRGTILVCRMLLVCSLGLFAGAAALGMVQPPEPAELPPSRLVQAALPLAPGQLKISADASPAPFVSETRIRRGDTLASLLQRLGLDDAKLLAFLTQDANARSFYKLYPGRSVQAATDGHGNLAWLRYVHTPGTDDEDGQTTTRMLVIEPDHAGGYRAEERVEDTSVETNVASGVIKSSLFAATDVAGIPDAVTLQMADILGARIDFLRDLRQGDQFRVEYETRSHEGRYAGPGRVLAVEFVNNGKTYNAMWFSPDGRTGAYYDFDGTSLHGAFLRTALKFTRISSTFGIRMHPLHKTWVGHMGVDYAAPVGTPIHATADGAVDFAGWQNGYGRIIIVRHPFGLETRYPHLNAIRVEVGQEVARGERVGDMGNSGRSTGSHLHYEVRVNGEAVDPMGYIRAGRDLL